MENQEKKKLPKSTKICTVIIILLLVASVVGGYLLYTYAYDEGESNSQGLYDSGYDEGYNDGLSEGEYVLIDKLNDEYGDVYEALSNYEWLDDHIVFTTRTGECYHSIDCQYIQDTTIYVYFIDGAIESGYRACSVCQ